MSKKPKPVRELDQIRQSCADKLRSVKTGNAFTAILGCLLQQDWSTPRIEELRLSHDRCLLGRLEGEATFKSFQRAEVERIRKVDLIRNVHGIAKVAKLDGDEVGLLLGEIAGLKRVE